MEHIPFPDNDRKKKALKVRDTAAHVAGDVEFPEHKSSFDETAPFIFSFTKGLPHDQNGLLNDPNDFELFKDGTEQHDPWFFEKVPQFKGSFETTSAIGELREWESPTAGHAYVIEGPDPFSLDMPQAPRMGSAEFAAEMAEVYQMALCRDWPLLAFMDSSLVSTVKTHAHKALNKTEQGYLNDAAGDVGAASVRLGKLRWFQGEAEKVDESEKHVRSRRRFGLSKGKGVTPATVFRGGGEDSWPTPFVSQFMLAGTGDRKTGLIEYGAQSIDQKVRVAEPGTDYMTDWAHYIDVQNGMKTQAPQDGWVPEKSRQLNTLRDLATYVHVDQLYQAYLNAGLILLNEGLPFDAGLPYHKNSGNPAPGGNREPFALFGNPHILDLLTSCSDRALKAVRLQKFSVHRRMRPEAAAALFHTVYSGYQPDKSLNGSVEYDSVGTSPSAKARSQLGGTIARYTFPQNTKVKGSEPELDDILTDVRMHNNAKGDGGSPSWLLPMAFSEGSPMHPAYGAGHATVAGACVTMLKAVFNMVDLDDENKPAYFVQPGGKAIVPGIGKPLHDDDVGTLSVDMEKGLTLEGELNKLMWNISNARNIAGVHYYTDYIESALLGEAITIGILREQMIGYHPKEHVNLTVPLLVPRKLPETLIEGSTIHKDDVVSAVKILSDGSLIAADPTPGR